MGTRDAVRSGRPWIRRSCNERAAEIDLGGTDFFVKTLRVIQALAELPPAARKVKKTAGGSACYGRLAVLSCECQKIFGPLLNSNFSVPNSILPGLGGARPSLRTSLILSRVPPARDDME
jgi:hypothetical protein